MLDDEAFARAWVESRDRARPRGERALRAELRQKGSIARSSMPSSRIAPTRRTTRIARMPTRTRRAGSSTRNARALERIAGPARPAAARLRAARPATASTPEVCRASAFATTDRASVDLAGADGAARRPRRDGRSHP